MSKFPTLAVALVLAGATISSAAELDGVALPDSRDVAGTHARLPEGVISLRLA